MKKIFMIFLFLILLTGCGGGATIPAYQQQGYSVKVIYNFGGLGIAIISTNKGIVTDKEARKLQVGGEVLAFVW